MSTEEFELPSGLYWKQSQCGYFAGDIEISESDKTRPKGLAITGNGWAVGALLDRDDSEELIDLLRRRIKFAEDREGCESPMVRPKTASDADAEGQQIVRICRDSSGDFSMQTNPWCGLSPQEAKDPDLLLSAWVTVAYELCHSYADVMSEMLAEQADGVEPNSPRSKSLRHRLKYDVLNDIIRAMIERSDARQLQDIEAMS